ncbi:Vps5-domain-containing protein [Aureobasidium pullulans EXF-150]|uniref:Vps5-domain-containing protein n=1 Tax=Aureobasidium pullulans EXF-150 TaxID=1043002 RepID=A0A074XF07_AURPU|nr:Vps5-domain-containing protein [Aureobasidium pullulans EXF-150]KEQ82329.1 Vps5-domain-containing protein [Aureobasidium pullulans EXF-150]
MDEDSPWGDVPSRSHSNSNLAAQATEDEPTTTTSTTETDTPAVTESTPAKVKSPPSKTRPSRRFGTQSTTLEALDDSLGPLGPLGDVPAEAAPVEERPAPPRKEQAARNAPPTALMESTTLDDDGTSTISGRAPPPVQPAPVADAPRRQMQPSVSIEQAAKPSFDISVGDPHKVGDLTSSHTVYQVRTKTSSKAYRTPEFTVSRRYRDFLWLYNQLHNNNPGVVVPPPPEKQAMNRFDLNFVESRRAALERMLNKAAAHPVLQHDGDLKIFLESETFNVDIKHKERKDVGLPETKSGGGMLGAIGLSVGSSTKFVEHDDWFHDRRIYLDALETQLKALLKSTDTVVAQRKSLAESCQDFSASLHQLASVELSPDLSAPLDALSDIQMRIRDLNDRQAQQDVLTLGIVIDEYIRLIGSIKTAFQQRQKAYHNWHTAEAALQKLKNTHDKLLRAGRTQQDRLSQMQADVADAERRVHQARLLFEDMGRLMRSELDRFEREKVDDFKSGVETFLESAIEAQKELIELWETYLLQLDADDDESAPYFAAGVNASERNPDQDASSRDAAEGGEAPAAEASEETGNTEEQQSSLAPAAAAEVESEA